jgi:hypothetical protein
MFTSIPSTAPASALSSGYTACSRLAVDMITVVVLLSRTGSPLRMSNRASPWPGCLPMSSWPVARHQVSRSFSRPLSSFGDDLHVRLGIQPS